MTAGSRVTRLVAATCAILGGSMFAISGAEAIPRSQQFVCTGGPRGFEVPPGVTSPQVTANDLPLTWREP